MLTHLLCKTLATLPPRGLLQCWGVGSRNKEGEEGRWEGLRGGEGRKSKRLRRGKERERKKMGRNSFFNLLFIYYQYSPFPPLSLTFPTLSPLLFPSSLFPFSSFLSSFFLLLPLSSLPPSGRRCGENEEAKTWTIPLDRTTQQRREGTCMWDCLFLKSTAPSCLWQTCSHALIILFHWPTS